MLVQLVDYQGTSFPEGKVTEISVKNSSKSTITKMPSLNKDYIQRMNKNVREFTLSGYVTGSDGIYFFRNALDMPGTLYYSSSAFGGTVIETTNVHFMDLQWKDDGNHPMERSFTVVLQEIKT
jgi:hypothetical protein